MSYHRVREAIAADIVRVIHIPGEGNPADVLTKTLGHGPLYNLTKIFIFYSRDSHPISDEKERPESNDPT